LLSPHHHPHKPEEEEEGAEKEAEDGGSETVQAETEVSLIAHVANTVPV